MDTKSINFDDSTTSTSHTTNTESSEYEKRYSRAFRDHSQSNSDHKNDQQEKNFYLSSENRKLIARKTQPSDIPSISQLSYESTKKLFGGDPAKLMETSCFSLVLAQAKNSKKVLAHATFDDNAYDQEIDLDYQQNCCDEGQLWFKNEQEFYKLTSQNSLFMKYFVSTSSTEVSKRDLLAELLALAFFSCPLVSHVLLQCPDVHFEAQIFKQTHGQEIFFKSGGKEGEDSGKTIKFYLFEKHSFFPKLNVREGREQDLDDLSPLIKIGSKNLEHHFNKSHLVEIISIADKKTQSIVAELNGISVGVICVSTDINYDLLNQNFHLEPFHGLYKPRPEEKVDVTSVKSQILLKRAVHLQDFYSGDSESISDGKSIKSGLFLPSYICRENDKQETNEESEEPDRQSTISGQSRISQLAQDFQKAKRKDSMKEFHLDLGEYSKDALYPAFSAGSSSSNETESSISGQSSRQGKNEDSSPDLSAESASKSLGVKKGQKSFAEEIVQSSILSNMHKALLTQNHLPLEINHQMLGSQVKTGGVPNAIAIQLCAIKPKFETRIMDLIEGAFNYFPTKDYIIVTIPSGVKVPFWFENFIRVVPRKESTFSKELYIAHRIILNFSSIRVRPSESVDDDAESVTDFLQSLNNNKKIFQDFLTSHLPENSGCLKSFLLTIMQETKSKDKDNKDKKEFIVGFAIAREEPNSQYYQNNYNLDNYAYFDLQESYSYLNYLVVNPIFQRMSKFFMKEIMRLTGTTSIFHKTYPSFVENDVTGHQSTLNNIEDFIPLAPRRTIDYDFLGLNQGYDEERRPPKETLLSDPHGVLYFTKKFSYEPKVPVHHRIVFIGASNAILTCIGHLISNCRINYHHLTVISPHGMPGSLPADEVRNFMLPRANSSGLGMTNDSEWYQKFGLKSWVNVVVGHCTKILRDKKWVIVNKTRVVPYDILVIGVGKQFVRPDCPEPLVHDEHLEKINELNNQQTQSLKLIQKINNEGSEKSDSVKNSDKSSSFGSSCSTIIPLPINVFMLNTEMDAHFALNFIRSYAPFVEKRKIIVHGACLESFCCVNALIKLGISPRRIVFVIQPAGQLSWENKNGYKDTLLLRKTILEEIENLGCIVKKDLMFKNWRKDEKTGIAHRVTFQSVNPTNGAEEDEELCISCLAYFPFVVKRMNDKIITALTEAFIVINDGIVINGDFSTNDPNIYAAGPGCVYQQRFQADAFNHANYASEDIGKYLAETLTKRLDPFRSPDIESDGRQPALVRKFKSPLVRHAQLPGGWNYLYVIKPSINSIISGQCHEPSEDCECSMCSDCGTILITSSLDKTKDPAQKYFRIHLDFSKRVEVIECFSKDRFSPSNLACLYGKHESILNQMLARLESGEIKDFFEFFSQPWITVLLTERWDNFKQELYQLYATHEVAPKIELMNFIKDYITNMRAGNSLKVDSNIIRRVYESSGLKQKMEMKFLDYLQFNRSLVPMYARPDFAQELVKERENSLFHQSKNPSNK